MLLTAQPRGQDRAHRHRDKRQRDDSKVGCACSDNVYILCIASEYLRRKDAGCKQEHHRDQKPEQHADIEAAPGFLFVAGTEKLCDEDTGDGIDRAEHYRENQRKVSIQADGGDICLTQLTDHDLVDDGKGGLQHALQGDRQRNFIKRFRKVRYHRSLVLSGRISFAGHIRSFTFCGG